MRTRPAGSAPRQARRFADPALVEARAPARSARAERSGSRAGTRWRATPPEAGGACNRAGAVVVDVGGRLCRVATVGGAQMAELPPPPEGIVLAHFIVSDDVERSRRFYTEVLGGRVVFSGPGGLTYVALANSVDHHQRRRRPDRRQAHGHPGDATRPRPGQQLPQHPGRDIARRVRRMERRGAQFLTPPKQHAYEIRCYIRDPDGYLIEVGQTDRSGRGLVARTGRRSLRGVMKHGAG